MKPEILRNQCFKNQYYNLSKPMWKNRQKNLPAKMWSELTTRVRSGIEQRPVTATARAMKLMAVPSKKQGVAYLWHKVSSQSRYYATERDFVSEEQQRQAHYYSQRHRSPCQAARIDRHITRGRPGDYSNETNWRKRSSRARKKGRIRAGVFKATPTVL